MGHRSGCPADGFIVKLGTSVTEKLRVLGPNDFTPGLFDAKTIKQMGLFKGQDEKWDNRISWSQ